MDSLGIVVWKNAAGAMILWCADTADLAYVAEGAAVKQGAVPELGDVVDAQIEKRGPFLIGVNVTLRSRGEGRGLVEALGAMRQEARKGAQNVFPFEAGKNLSL